MTIAIIVGVLALALGPLFWALPSRREREQAQLRSLARAHGLSMQLTEIDHPSPTAEQRVSAGGKTRRPMLPCVCYRLPRVQATTADAAQDTAVDASPSRVLRRRGARSAELLADWRVDDGFAAPDAAVLALLPELGNDVFGLESTRHSVAVFWNERGGSARLLALEAMLRQLSARQQSAL